jgi:uncharacterized protein (DUF342 family)
MTVGDVPGAGLSFQMSQEGKKLLAVFEPVADAAPIDKTWVNQELAEQGFADLFIFADTLNQLVKQYNSGSGFTLTIGERRDGTFSINIDTDLMAAHLTMTPSCGGNPVTSNQVYEALKEKGIVFGVLDETIESSVAKGYARNKLIAEGVHPTQGEDAQLLSLIQEIKDSRQDFDDSATIDYRNFGNIITVKQGDPLMRRVPPTEGNPGTNILGSTIPAAMGNDVQFSSQLNGAALSQDDPDLLVAVISGRPVLVPNAVNVEPVITIKNVDLSTGNLDIEGTLNITGDVKPGMHVKATGDIVIEGFVEAAYIEAGGDIEIKGGLIGHGEVRNNDNELNPAAAVIRANGSVKALFVENAFISSSADIVVHEFVMNSELNAGNRIMVGEPGSSKGRIISALCRATSQIDAITIGSRAGVSTVVEVGADPSVLDKLTSVKDMLLTKEKEMEEITKALAYLRENPNKVSPDMLKEKEKAFHRLQTEIQELSGQKRRLQKRMELVDNASIKVEREVYSGVRIKIGEMTLLLDQEMENVTFRIGEDGITY